MEKFFAGTAALMAFSAITLVGLAARRVELRHEYAHGKAVTDWRDYASGGQREGPDTAAVTVVVFTDYRCPFSRFVARRLNRIREEMPDEVAVVYRNFPLGQSRARQAAVATVCASRQGMFKAFHDHITLAGPAALGRGSWESFAHGSGVPDIAAFSTCLESAAAQASVDADTAAGNRLGITSTPTVLINDRMFVGVRETLDSLVESAAAEARQRR